MEDKKISELTKEELESLLKNKETKNSGLTIEELEKFFDKKETKVKESARGIVGFALYGAIAYGILVFLFLCSHAYNWF